MSTAAPSPVAKSPPKEPAAHVPDGLKVVVVANAEELASHAVAWDDLARHAIEPNAFYESWMFLPALRAFGAELDLQCVLIYAPQPGRPGVPGPLYGFFPLERARRYKGLPVPMVRMWKHVHCFLGTPLVRAGHAQECLNALLDWLKGQRRGLLEFGLTSADGPFQQALLDVVNERRALTYLQESYNRALLCTGTAVDDLLELSGRHKKELRRQRRRLSEQGRFECVRLESSDDLAGWLERFLELEASGWKGREGTAIRETPAERDFFVQAATAAFERGRLMMLGFHLNGKPVSLKCNFLAPPGSFAFKIAFDESFASYSPGVLLELENIEQLNRYHPEIAWMDSCAMAQHFMINRLWSGRRTVQTLLVSTGTRRSDLVVSALPMLRWLRRQFKR
jgi:CelD/BcsL family acetyltransferase involved in cellulose biosynthesis